MMILQSSDPDPIETTEWLDSLASVLQTEGPPRAGYLLGRLLEKAQQAGAATSLPINTPYINTIPVSQEPPYPGDRALERRIKSIIRWNAMAMVVRAYKRGGGVGGHISTFASSASLYEVGFNHFFRGKTEDSVGDQIYFQGHAAPGMYARAFLEGRLGEQKLDNFRRELAKGGGLSSYPHPWLMPDFWEFPTVSMGLAPIMSIYQARFNRYLQDRGLTNTENSRVWAFLGDGEMDEPESLGAITLASREGLDNLTWIVNCNLQRLDGPVRGNGKIIQELEAAFRGAGWNVIKVIWGGDWDPLLEADEDGLLVQRMNEVVDGQYQKFVVESGGYIRDHFFGVNPFLLNLVEGYSDERLRNLRRGGHDPAKVYAAYKAAVEHRGGPTVILAKTVKGYGLGESAEGKNVAHQVKNVDEDDMREFRDRFEIPVSDAELVDVPFYHPGPKSPEVQYMLERRAALGGPMPRRLVRNKPITAPGIEIFSELLQGTGKDRDSATTMAFVRALALLLKDKDLGDLIVPIVPDEARTFGMESLFRPYGIYSHCPQRYEPVDIKNLLYYREAEDGQILEEGINEAGSMSSFIAAGTAYSTHGINTIPFFIFYSMFGFQRIGDLIWANADARGRGFLLGATAGRTTLNGEGLQHEDGHSLLLASTVPTCQPYDPAYAYEVAVILQDGIRRMYQENESIFYYLTLYNEKYEMPPLPKGVNEGILKGMYKLRAAPRSVAPGFTPAARRDAAGVKPAATAKRKAEELPRVHLFGSGSILTEALRAQTILDEQFHVQADVWSVTSYVLLRRDGLDADRWNLLHPTETKKKAYVSQMLEAEPWPVIAVSDFMKALPDGIARWCPAGLYALGTDGFGRSETRESLRHHFEITAEFTAWTALCQLAQRGQFDAKKLPQAMQTLGIDANKLNPFLM